MDIRAVRCFSYDFLWLFGCLEKDKETVETGMRKAYDLVNFSNLV